MKSNIAQTAKSRGYNDIFKNAQHKVKDAINAQIKQKNYVYKANRNLLIKCDIKEETKRVKILEQEDMI